MSPEDHSFLLFFLDGLEGYFEVVGALAVAWNAGGADDFADPTPRFRSMCGVLVALVEGAKGVGAAMAHSISRFGGKQGGEAFELYEKDMAKSRSSTTQQPLHQQSSRPNVQPRQQHYQSRMRGGLGPKNGGRRGGASMQ